MSNPSPSPKSGYAFAISHADAARAGSWSRAPNDDWETVMFTPRHTSNYMWVGRRRVDGSEVNVWDDAHGRRYIAQTTVMTGRSLSSNPLPPWWPWAAGAAALAVWWISTSTKQAFAGFNPLAPLQCPVDKQKFEAWLIEKQLAGECAPDVKNPPYTYVDLQKAGLAPAEFSPYVLVIGDGTFWYYSNLNAPVAKSENLRSQFASYLSTVSGPHIADTFTL